MDEKSAKPKRMGNHYIPPPARKQGFETNEGTRHKERPMKTSENRGVKLCNDSSLLFKESNDKVKEKSRRSRRSKRIAKKADVENAVQSGNQVVEPKSSSATSGLTDRIINCQSDQGIDSSVLVERPNARVVLPLVDLENMKLRHPVELTATDGSGEGGGENELLKHHCSDQDIVHVPQIVENQLHTMKMFPPSDHGNTVEVENECGPLNGVKLDSSRHDTIEDIPEKVENPLSSLEPLQSNDLVTDRLGEESQKTTLKCGAVSEDFNSHEPAFSITEEDSSNLCSELCDSIRTSSQESIENCDVVNSYDTNNYSSSPTEIECSKLRDSSASPGSTKWTETSQHYHLRSIEDGDWESIYDDRGECLLPSVGSVNPYSPEVVKKDVQMKASDKKEGDDDDQPHETSSIIEIYGFSEDLKTNDILNAFGNWNQRGFNLKWVDNTHALGIFPTPALAEEVLSSNIPIVKIRPISQGTTLSQERAKTLVLPSSLRPKTCTALARRLVSGALGLRVNVTPEERAAERELLREAREKKKLALKQRDAAWEGNFSSLECSEEKASN